MVNSKVKNRHLASIATSFPVMLCLLFCVCSSTACQNFNQQIEVAPTPTPYYAPLLSGRVFVTTLEIQVLSIPFWSKPGLGFYGGHVVFSRASGTLVEIVQSAWVATPGDPGCYYYLVSTDDGLTGWTSGEALTPDLSQPSPEVCFEPPKPTITPEVLIGAAFLTTLGSSKEVVDVWSGPTLDEGDSHYLFSKPNGTQVDPIQYKFFTGPNGQRCHVYFIRTQDGLEGWVAEGWLAQNPDLSPMNANCRK